MKDKFILMDEDLDRLKVIGKGTERVCYQHPDYPNRCIKLSLKTKSKQTKREISYLSYLIKKRVDFVHIPIVYSIVETESYIGMEVEKIVNDDSSNSLDIKNYIKKMSSKNDIDNLLIALDKVKCFLLENNIIPCDLQLSNLLVMEKQGKIVIYVIDGYGSSEFIPFSNYVRLLGSSKIERKWCKFMDYVVFPCLKKQISNALYSFALNSYGIKS